MQKPSDQYYRPSRRAAPARQNRWLDRLIPRLGRSGMVIGVGGLFVGTLGLALIVAILLRLVISTDALNPFQQRDSSLIGDPNATPNPAFLAPTLDLGYVQAWQGTEPVMVLLLGADSRPAERGVGRPRTDTMILLMADPIHHRAGMLSIPRDLFVDVPGFGLNRINTAYPIGGSQLTIQTVEYNLGIRINYYALLEFNVFVTLVDEIGGVDMDVPEAIYDTSYPTEDYGYEIFSLGAGMQHLDGATALKYARTRHGSSDYDRAKRQQALIFAIRDKVLALDMLPTLIQKSPSLYQYLAGSIDTNMTLDQMIGLALLAKDIPRENIRAATIDANYVIDYETDDGAQVEIPNRANIGELLAYVFWLR